ncbi:hypothetical protein ACB094_01G339200 [Castanea mollissima]
MGVFFVLFYIWFQSPNTMIPMATHPITMTDKAILMYNVYKSFTPKVQFHQYGRSPT